MADSALVDGAERIFRDLADPQTVNNAAGDSWRAPLWRALEDAGVTRGWLPESAGGRLSGTAAAVPFAAGAEHLAVVAGGRVALVAGADCRVAHGVNLANEPRGDVTFDAVRPLAVSAAPADPRALAAFGAVARAVQMTGALEAILDMTVSYAGERVAFGRPIARFQAIQHELARLAGETAAAASALDAGGAVDDRAFMDVAAAKIRVGEAAQAGAAIAHQVHGAIGFTEEHILQRYTRRLWSWRDDFGAESRWAATLGEMVAAAGADAFWPLLAQS